MKTTTGFSLLLVLAGIIAVGFGACPETIQGLQPWSTLRGAAPSAGSTVTIGASEKILLDVDFPTSTLTSINIQGILVLKPGRSHVIHTQNININNGGQLWIGSEDYVTITLYASGSDIAMFGQKFIGLDGPESRLEIHGKPTSRWTHLASTAQVGATQITLVESVDWSAGGSIVIATTDYDSEQTEVRTVDQVLDGGRTLTFSDPLQYMHFADYVGDDHQGFTIRAEVGYLTRNIVIKGADNSGGATFGGHLMAMGGTMHLSEIEFTKMGQTGLIGRYPVHFHLAQNTMAGSTVKNCAIHDNYQRCITVHGTHNITIEGNTAYNNIGHCYFVEDGYEQDNWFKYNLGLNAIASTASGVLPSDSEPSIFWITNPRNHLIGNAAGGAAVGIWYAFPINPLGSFSTLFPNAPIWQRHVLATPLGVFFNNTAHSAARGLFVDHGPDSQGNTGAGKAFVPRDYSTFRETNTITDIEKWGDRVTAIFDHGTVYKCYVHGVWSRGDSIIYRNFHYADNGNGHQFAGVDQRIQNAIMIGKSSNIGSGFGVAEYGRSRPYKNADNPILGYRFYHDIGPTALANVHFSDFYTETVDNGNKKLLAGAIGTESGYFSIYVGRSRFYNVSMHNSEVKFLVNTGITRGDTNANMVDTDGTLTGVCGTQILATSNWMQYESSQCDARDSWFAVTCPPTYQQARIVELRDMNNIKVLATGGNSYTRSITRIHALYGERRIALMYGAISSTAALTGDPNTYDYDRLYSANILVNGDYLLEFALGGTSDLTITPKFLPVGEWFRFAIPYPADTTFDIRNSQYYEAPYTRVNSLNELTFMTYFFDSATNLLWIRLEALSNEFLWAPRTNPFGPFVDHKPEIRIKATCGACVFPTVNPNNVNGEISITEPLVKRCGQTMLGGYSTWTENSSTKLNVFNGSDSDWRISNRNSATFNVVSNVIEAEVEAVPSLYFSPSNDLSAFVDPTPYTHLKISLKFAKYYESVQPISVAFWKVNKNTWESDGSIINAVEISSPWFMERPPVNTTYKTAYLPLDELKVKSYGKIAGFVVMNKWNRAVRVDISEIAFVDVRHSVIPLDGAESCWTQEHCDLSTDYSVSPSGSTPSNGPSFNSPSTGNPADPAASVSLATSLIPSLLMLAGFVSVVY